MPVSSQEKEDLHLLLDYILLAREGLERIDPSQLGQRQFYPAWSKPRAELLYNASKFLRRAVGSRLMSAEHSLVLKAELIEDAKDTDHLATLANAIRPFLPLFSPLVEGEERSDFIVGMIDDIMGIYWGDEPRFFSVLPKRQGLHKRPFRLAKLRCRALDWEKFLEAAGLSAFERQRVVADAFKTNWDAIRKWRDANEEFDVYSWPPTNPQHAFKQFRDNRSRILSEIERDGAEYWNEKASAKLGKQS